MIDEELEITSETIEAGIDQMIKNYPQLVIRVMIENIDYIMKTTHKADLLELYYVMEKRVNGVI